ncbi:hypothetical protein [Ottowia sp.]|uniref:hypothetical protein n=1 Tax=Ottowia sp. TaxID=1898956 RepID=UPI0025E5ED72|nr:hypothetical protein [Ottowia sp.]MBK6613879.1 hypothetical protein [Ottowia sp.]MBK6745558.1 hypothetical protein [Ottowia sp.]
MPSCLLVGVPAQATAWPDEIVRVEPPHGAGGSSDIGQEMTRWSEVIRVVGVQGE